MKIKKSILVLSAVFFTSITFSAYSQEALKSLEEEYYDFLSLQGLCERPSLNYRTLSDSEWFINTEKSSENPSEKESVSKITENSDSIIQGETEIINAGEAETASVYTHPWQNNNPGKKITLWEASSKSENWFIKGIGQDLKLKIYGPEWFNSYNTDGPYGQNDGALWQGKGYNTSLTAGVRIEGFGFEGTIKPQLSFSQNSDFDLIADGVYGSKYSYFYSEGGSVDLVQRYGDSAFWNFDWGDSEIRWSLYNFTIGFGTQSPWIGPAWLNPMLGSNNAPTYPKLDIGLRRTKIIIPGIHWHLGDIEARLWTGYLSESDYFDNDSSNDHNMINGLSFSFAPSFIPGLTLGVNRVFLTKWKMENLKYLGRLFTTNDENNSDEGDDGKITFTADFCFPKIGFEAYGELGIDDYAKMPVNLFHTAIYTVGVKQIIPIYKKIVKSELILEWNNFEMSQDFQIQWPYKGFFSHGKISQGYTNKGQTLAGGSGTFGNSQYLGWKVYYPKGTSTLFFHRFCPDNNYVYNQGVDNIASDVNNKWYNTWMCCMAFGGETSWFVTKSLVISGAFHYIKTYNSRYVLTENTDNFYLSLDIKYNF